VWAAQNFPNGTLKNHLEDVQVDMMEAVHGLYANVGVIAISTNGAP
jgi:hypothetical protein